MDYWSTKQTSNQAIERHEKPQQKIYRGSDMKGGTSSPPRRRSNYLNFYTGFPIQLQAA